MAVAKSAERKYLNAASNLAVLLPTGTVLAFQALEPSFSNNGSCLPANKYLTLCMIVIISIVCFFSSFTDSFIDNGKLYYGIATTNGICIFNSDVGMRNDMASYKLSLRDVVHAFSSLLVFLVFAISSTDVQNCFFPHSGASGKQLMINLPLGVSALASLLFLIFPTKRRGIGYTERPLPAQDASPTP